MSSLYRLVYHSRNTLDLGTADMQAEIDKILSTARQKNQAVGITGALMFNQGCFAQVLEGPEAAIASTFERIQRDFRHAEIMVMEFTPIAERSFPHWSMAFVGQQQAHADAYGDIARDSGFEGVHENGDQVLQTLKHLVLEEESFRTC